MSLYSRLGGLLGSVCVRGVVVGGVVWLGVFWACATRSHTSKFLCLNDVSSSVFQQCVCSLSDTFLDTMPFESALPGGCAPDGRGPGGGGVKGRPQQCGQGAWLGAAGVIFCTHVEP